MIRIQTKLKQLNIKIISLIKTQINLKIIDLLVKKLNYKGKLIINIFNNKIFKIIGYSLIPIQFFQKSFNKIACVYFFGKKT